MSVDTTLHCVACSEAVHADDVFCEACGNRLAATPEKNEQKVDENVAAAVTNRGRVRPHNEDAFTIHVADGVAVAVVCDGVASSSHGDLAAQVAAEVAMSHLSAALTSHDSRGRNPEVVMAEAMDAAQKRVVELPWQPPAERNAPACTLVSALWDGTRITVGSVGDSRAYWIAEADVEQLTVDESWAQEQVDAGRMSASTAHRSRHGHAITRWLGADSPDEPFQLRSLIPSTAGHIVLCTDGLWQYTPTPQRVGALVRAQGRAARPIDIATALVDAALAAGGSDNVTAAVIEVTIEEGTSQ